MEQRFVLVALPQDGFDPTETAVPWRYLSGAGFEIFFTTPSGTPGRADPRMVTGEGLGLWKGLLMADSAAVEDYRAMESTVPFRSPLPYSEIKPERFDALLLPGGHAKGMRKYLESPVMQGIVASFFASGRPVGAICHGTLLAGRSISPDTGKSVLWGRRTTGLTYWQEMLAWGLTCLYRGNYYRTYRTPLESELKSYLQQPDHYTRGPMPVKRDSGYDFSPGYTVLDRNYLSARWPGDAHKFGSEFTELVRTYR